MTDEQTPTFESFDLDPRIGVAVTALGWERPTPIQAASMTALLQGRDMVGRARTGSGKTAAFGLPLAHRLRDGGRTVRALVLAPTRELAMQVTEALRSYVAKLPIRVACVYGGASYEPQLQALRSGVDVVVATPGRALDLLDRGVLDLSAVEYVVLDEADEMLRMGFIEDVERMLAATPPGRQTALFSATMPAPIRRIAEQYLTEPVTVEVEEHARTVHHITQVYVVVPERSKRDALLRILAAEPHETVLVFTRTRKACAELADALAECGLAVDSLHGDMNQGARERVLLRLRAGHLDILAATDVAARGLDIDHVSHVVNYDWPDSIETYVHRIGRTGRAGRAGTAITLVRPGERRRIGELRHTLHAHIEEFDVPSDADIARGQLRGLEQTLLDAREKTTGGADDAAGLVARMMEATGCTAAEVAEAAVRALAAARGVSLQPTEPEEPEASAAPRDESDHLALFIAAGRIHGVRPGDLVGSLANDAGLDGADIGRVQIADRMSFVALPPDLLRQLLADRSSLLVRGVEVRIAEARPGTAAAARDRNDRNDRNDRRPPPSKKGPPKKGGPKGPKKQRFK